jgi:hypothetical protein
LLFVQGTSQIRGPLAIAGAVKQASCFPRGEGVGRFVEQVRGKTREQVSVAAAAPAGVP